MKRLQIVGHEYFDTDTGWDSLYFLSDGNTIYHRFYQSIYPINLGSYDFEGLSDAAWSRKAFIQHLDRYIPKFEFLHLIETEYDFWVKNDITERCLRLEKFRDLSLWLQEFFQEYVLMSMELAKYKK